MMHLLASADVEFYYRQWYGYCIESADIALMRGSLHECQMLCRKAFSGQYTGDSDRSGIHPFTGLLLNPIIAGAAMAMSSVTVVSNANRPMVQAKIHGYISSKFDWNNSYNIVIWWFFYPKRCQTAVKEAQSRL
jgi:hypothetical protein